MARYIVIETSTGYIWGDTADFTNEPFEDSNRHDDANMFAACRAIDATIGEHGRAYEMLNSVHDLNGRDGYMVYRADVGGSDAVVTVWDGQDQETIRAVERDCELVGVVAWP